MRRVGYALWVAGLALFIVLVIGSGAGKVAASLERAGAGILLLLAWEALPLLTDTLAWRVLQPRPVRRGFWRLALFRWYGEAVNTLVPFGQLGGDLLRGRLHAATGVPGPVAMGIAVVDLATTVYAQMIFAALGLLGFVIVGRGRVDLVWRLGAALAILGLLIAGFHVAQQRGLFGGVIRLAGALLPLELKRSRTYAEGVDRTMRRLYRRPGPLGRAMGLHLLAWAFGAGEVWIAGRLVMSPLTLAEAAILESLICVVRAASFMVPGALGVQEGGFVVLGGIVGLSPADALAISLLKRARELAWGIPGLLAWQSGELVHARRSI